ncbi:hypothetical protein DXX93_08865 [Thalassotalea euphylliae]|uniref:DUF4174 domain-containing protein n=1 Tax=Thalassotalea euphylliae TaxID=1655234 RepID=A0A3E0TQA6_9GAMM|nr:hypothetical protein [Thalassotalea euphylliae]REL26678.1 hypothetical protein DXX93_08865 [Thalassotalea euphylliae]
MKIKIMLIALLLSACTSNEVAKLTFFDASLESYTFSNVSEKLSHKYGYKITPVIILMVSRDPKSEKASEQLKILRDDGFIEENQILLIQSGGDEHHKGFYHLNIADSQRVLDRYDPEFNVFIISSKSKILLQSQEPVSINQIEKVLNSQI